MNGVPQLAAQEADDEAVSAKARPIARTNPGYGHAEPAVAGDDGRSDSASTRRGKGSDRRDLVGRADSIGSSSLDPSYEDYRFFIPGNWHLISLFIATSLALAQFVSWALPSLFAVTACGASAGLAGLGGILAKVERRHIGSEGLGIGLMIVTIAAPMLLLGLVVGHQIFAGSLNPYWGAATVLAMTITATVLLNRRFVSIAVAQLCGWTGLVAYSGSTMAALALSAVALMLTLQTFHLLNRKTKQMEHQRTQERIRTRAEAILRDYEETGQGWFWETDRRGQLTYLSESVARTLGRTERELLSRHVTELFQLGDKNQDGERSLTFHLSSRSSFQELAVRAKSIGEELWWSINGRPVYDELRNFVGFRGSGMDLTEKRRSQEKASRLAHYDSLTGLSNRFQMSQSLEKILNSPQERERECAVLLLDLDRFKQVNDTLGHPTGDALLKQVAQRLERTVGKSGRVGRIGGDEFKIIVPAGVRHDRLAGLSESIIHSVSEPYSIDGQRVTIGVSIGIALCPDNGVTSEALIRNADLALYAAKDGGRGRYHFFARDLHSAAEERSALEQDLRDAISEGDLELFYQPVVSTKNEQITGLEALLRWNHPTKGWLSPEKFIPIAEETGLISAIGEWALRTACHQLAKFPEEVRCAVNVSPLQFANPNLPAIITNALAQAGVNPARLELEITESVFLNEDEGTDTMFAALKNIGVRLALDDFGTGYSSLGYLKKAPFDKIKIDQSFVRGATEMGSRNGAIITSITSLAEALGMDTTAEGVETHDELELVRKLGCSHVQGYIYEKAMSAEAIRSRLDSGLRAVASGPRSARVKRQKSLRKVVIEHGGDRYEGKIRNITATGALVEGLWNVPAGTLFAVTVSDKLSVNAVCKWSDDDKMGVEFSVPLKQAEASALLGYGQGAGSK